MRNAEAARYSYWAAAAAILLLVSTGGIYARRSWLQYRERKNAPAPVSATIQQQSDGFSFSKVDQDRTIFTIRASKATEFKEKNQSLLEDVSITMFGADGSRKDTMRTKECSYDPSSGDIRCQGEVQIELETALEAREPGQPRAIRIDTRDLQFNQQSGNATTPEPVSFHFAGGSGTGVGLTYKAGDSKLRLEHDVHLTLAATKNPKSPPALLDGSSLELDRTSSTAYLFGPAHAEQGGRNLACGLLSLRLDAQMRAREIVATDKPELASSGPSERIQITAGTIHAALDPAGWVQQIVLDDAVHGARQTAMERDTFSAQHVEIRMAAGQNQPEQMIATGSVGAEMNAGGNLQRLQTASLRIGFTSGARPRSRRIANAETLSPARLDWETGADKTRIQANRFNAEFAPDGQIEKLLGHSNVQIDRETGSQPPQHSTADEFGATFAGGDWTTLVLDRHVTFRQADRTAESQHAEIDRQSDLIQLEGSPAVSDSLTRTTAAKIEIHQQKNEIHAAGDVQTTYVTSQAAAHDDSSGKSTDPSAIELGYGPAHISADALNGNSASGHLVYSGHARFWQGDAVLNANEIELWRSENRMQARENVVAAIPQRAGSQAESRKPAMWDVRAPLLDFWNDTGRAYLQGGVTGVSAEGSVKSRTLELFLSASPDSTTQSSIRPNTAVSNETGRQLERAVAKGDVVVQQGDRRGVADQGIYTTSDGKFVLSGGQPTLTDASTDTTTVGRSLTFFVANDTILVDSQSGSRALTKHRVEK
jgi:lipopolysaccharide export system protein LptA